MFFCFVLFVYSFKKTKDDWLRWNRGIGETTGRLRSVRRQQFHLSDSVGHLHGAAIATRLQFGGPAAQRRLPRQHHGIQTESQLPRYQPLCILFQKKKFFAAPDSVCRATC